MLMTLSDGTTVRPLRPDITLSNGAIVEHTRDRNGLSQVAKVKGRGEMTPVEYAEYCAATDSEPLNPLVGTRSDIPELTPEAINTLGDMVARHGMAAVLKSMADNMEVAADEKRNGIHGDEKLALAFYGMSHELMALRLRFVSKYGEAAI